MEVNFKDMLERGKPGSVRILNRIVAVTGQGLECEADRRHAETLMKDARIDESSKGVVTPGVVTTSEGGQGRERETRGGENLLREAAARGN